MYQEILISICVPAYKRTDFLRRLLDSISVQSFRNFEVIITDDSPDNALKELCDRYKNVFSLCYYHNPAPFGTPENWNEAIRKATGQWIKLMHDDDWFAFPDSLQKLYDLTRVPENCSFVFCGSTVVEDNKVLFTENISRFREKLLRKDSRNLFSRNCIGPPSVIMHKNDRRLWYDNRMKWLVDVDFYIRYLQGHAFNFTREFLINVGFNEEQVTRQVFHDPEVVIPENLLLMDKLDPSVLLRLWNYDFCWRMIRNYKIRDEAALYRLSPRKVDPQIPLPLLHILRAQKNIPPSLLNIGLFSKVFMLFNYFTYFIKKWI